MSIVLNIFKPFCVGRAKGSIRSYIWQDNSRHHCICKNTQLERARILYHIYRKCSRYSPPEQQLASDPLGSSASAALVHTLLDHILKEVQQVCFFTGSMAFLLFTVASWRNSSAESRGATRFFRYTSALYCKRAKVHSCLIVKYKTPPLCYLLVLTQTDPELFRQKRIL